MDYTNASYVRIYTDVSTKATTYGFFGRALMDSLVKFADRAGVMELPEDLVGDLPTAVASVIGCDDVEWVEQYLPRLMKGPHASVELHRIVDKSDGVEKSVLWLPRYIDAQYSGTNASFSTKMSRKKTADIARATEQLGLVPSIVAEAKSA